ncbi:MAG: immunoglobulin domain-containing protein [Candidatus Hydrogenedentes bacterium]|nr:immunoglobulin domain-containing protein [Candidatus Hydrogenedentota bacterium]
MRSRMLHALLRAGLPVAAMLIIVAAASAGERTAGSGSGITGDALTSGGGGVIGASGSMTGGLGQLVVGRSAAGSGAVLIHGVFGPAAGSVVTPLSAAILGPASVIETIGAGHTFEVSVSGATGTVHYQWLFEGESKAYLPIDGAENPTLELTDLGPDDEGNYVCEVSDDVTTVQSPPVHLTVTAGMSLFEVPQFRELGGRTAQE